MSTTQQSNHLCCVQDATAEDEGDFAEGEQQQADLLG